MTAILKTDMMRQASGGTPPQRSIRMFGIEPFFLPSSLGALFSVYYAPSGKPRGGVLFAPPFAEEMHKSRRMCALQMRRFAEQGYAALHIDLPGCGDSEGEFKDASWEGWLDSLSAGYDWLCAKVDGPVVVWGLRLGCALAVELSCQAPGTAGLLLWQPATNGEVFLNQFLRIKLAAEMLAEAKSQTGLKQLRGQLAKGEPVEVGGYMLSPRLAARIDAVRLAQMSVVAPAHWFEVSSLGDAELSPAGSRVVAAWTGSGCKVSAGTVVGDAFWATQEITECPALIPASSRALTDLLA